MVSPIGLCYTNVTYQNYFVGKIRGIFFRSNFLITGFCEVEGVMLKLLVTKHVIVK